MNYLNYIIEKLGIDKLNIPVKLRLFFPIAFIIIFVIAIATTLLINRSIDAFNLQIERNLSLEVETITKMFERERQLKLEKVKTNLKVAHNLFYSQILDVDKDWVEVDAMNQETQSKHKVRINNWLLSDEILNADFSFVDSVRNLLGGTATIFQKIDSGYIRVSTNVMNTDGARAINTYIPNTSPVIETIEKEEVYYGRAYVVNDWYVTAYEPILKNGNVIGILYVGNKEKDLDKLRKILYGLKIGKTGYPYVFDKDGNIIIHPHAEGQNWSDSTLFKQFVQQEKSIIQYKYLGKDKTAAYQYFKGFEFYIVASIETKEEKGDFIKNTIIISSIIAIIAIIILLSLLYFMTAERLYKYLTQLDISEKKLLSVNEALKQSEDRFQNLFNSTGDDIFVTDESENIIEVNQASCISLGYNREELLSKKMSDIKTKKFVQTVSNNRRKIYELGTYTFESEHVAKDGKVIPVEIASRVVEYNNEKLILSIVRNIGIRKETERKILSTVIKTEERERERFAKDMHDSVGPLLSTIKLYVNELKGSNLEEKERVDFVNQTNEIIDEAIVSIRTISNNLMPRVINNYGLVKALEAFCEKVNKTNTIKIEFVKKNIDTRFDQNMELILFRVVTELINNTLKHAKAGQIKILLERAGSKVLMAFGDDGVGFNVDEIMQSDHKGMGLKNIISRVKSINGDCNFNSTPGKGFRIDVHIDL